MQIAALAKTGPLFLRPLSSAAYWAMTELPARLEAALPSPPTASVPGSISLVLGPSGDACAAAFALNASTSRAPVGAFEYAVVAEADPGSLYSAEPRSGPSMVRTDR